MKNPHHICVVVKCASLLARFSGGSDNYVISISDACRKHTEMFIAIVMRYENICDLYW